MPEKPKNIRNQKQQRQLAPAKDSSLFLEDLKKKWMATVDAIIDPLMIVGSDYQVLKSNKALASYGNYDIKDVVGKKCYKVLADRDSPCPGCPIQQIFESQGEKKKLEFENLIRGKFHEVTSQPILAGNGELEGVLTIYRDRTEAKELQSQLLQSEKMASIGLLAGGIAHEINNPLGGILIFSQMMLREMEEDNPHYKDAKEIEGAAQRCKEIIQSLLEFAREQPMTESDGTEVDIQESILAALNFALVGNNRREINIIQRWSDQQFHFRCNQNRIIQAFLNLIQNAIQAMPRGGNLTLSSFVVDRKNIRCVCYEVEDTGLGIEPSEITKVFDPFYTSKEPGEGTGLGLSICHSIIKELGGEIEALSVIGESTKFRVYLPLNAACEITASA